MRLFPSSARECAAAAPIPLPAPVMSIVFMIKFEQK
jgi:hypothetical protein